MTPNFTHIFTIGQVTPYTTKEKNGTQNTQFLKLQTKLLTDRVCNMTHFYSAGRSDNVITMY